MNAVDGLSIPLFAILVQPSTTVCADASDGSIQERARNRSVRIAIDTLLERSIRTSRSSIEAGRPAS